MQGDPEALEEADGEPLGHSTGSQLIARRDEQNQGAPGDSFCMTMVSQMNPISSLSANNLSLFCGALGWVQSPGGEVP